MPASEKMLKDIKDRLNINVYFETGLAEGNGVRKALRCGFEKVYSLELCDRWIEEGRENFKNEDRVILIQDDSQNLASHIKDINERTLFFLDAHNDHSNMLYKQSSVDCPILFELEAIKSSPVKDHAIIIDDVRVLRNKRDDTLRAIGGEFRGMHCVNWGKNMNLKEIEEKILTVNPKYETKYVGDQIVSLVL